MLQFILEVVITSFIGVMYKKFSNRNSRKTSEPSRPPPPSEPIRTEPSKPKVVIRDFKTITSTGISSRKTMPDGTVVWKEVSPTTVIKKTEYPDGRVHVKEVSPTTTREWWE